VASTAIIFRNQTPSLAREHPLNYHNWHTSVQKVTANYEHAATLQIPVWIQQKQTHRESTLKYIGTRGGSGMHSCSPWLHETGAGANSLSYRGYTPALVDQQNRILKELPSYEDYCEYNNICRFTISDKITTENCDLKVSKLKQQ